MTFGGRGGSFGGREGRGRPFLPKPVKEGDELDVTIEAVGSRGDGIGKIEGFVIFVQGAAVGEKIRVRIKEVRGRSAIAERI